MDNNEIKNNRILKISVILVVLILVFVIVYFYQNSDDQNLEYAKIDTESTKLDVEYTNQELTGEWSNYSAKIILDDTKTIIEGTGVTNTGNTIKISSAGTYYITGSISDGNIIIDGSKNDEVQLVLDNASITSKSTAPINGIKCNKLTITLADNSENIITDSKVYTTFTDTEKSEPDGAIFTKTDLIINGNGKLNVNANYLDGIVSKDGLKIINSNITIKSKDDGIRGKDYVAINNANINITSEGDGIRSTNTEDGELGYIAIEGGNIEVTSTDDSIHSNGIIVINNGNIKLSSGDDGIHADTNIVINEGNIDIAKSYEGIESAYIEINAGTISVVSSDDGINVAGGNDSSSIDGRQGQNSFSKIQSSDRKLVINNGDVFVNASGDGLDANGSMYINGGNITVAGPTSAGNGALDYDGECVVTGGNLIIYGAYGMWQNPSSNSTQYSISFQKSGNAGDLISLKDSSENEITSFKTEKIYGGITISNSNIKQGNTYTLYVNGTSVGSLQANNIITSNSSSNGNEMQGGGKGMRKDIGGKPRF